VDFGVREPPEDPVDRLPSDDLPALRACVNVAMDACEVAKLAQIKLEDICAFAITRQVVIGQGPRKKLTAWPIKFRGG
jgi:hypothetical protein